MQRLELLLSIWLSQCPN